ncbi:MAG: tRNA (adenosine(37)-N6)-threonylcarbamoyltransferase complex ATPase subunit type 1 TsaE [Candidatus Dormiibacterota bacterium]
MELTSASAAQTRSLGSRLGARLQPGDCIALRGQLGAGKTTLVQGIVAGAGGGHDVRSPTFLLHAVHPGRVTVHHLDLYRLPEDTDLLTLGLDEALQDGAAVVEWADRAAPGWFSGEVEISWASGQERRLSFRLVPRLAEALSGG